ncbi:MAG: hypothetical protein KDK65_03035 [Chlamydiia bacterium]|nr:hypothetical protein [Chlamydiia bacterium]
MLRGGKIVITLHNETLKALFSPEQGMTLMSFMMGDIEIIDQSTRKPFDTRRSGLGPLIGPHFHQKKDSAVTFVPDPAQFPHLAHTHSKDPFSHGIARYAPWQTVTHTATTIDATLSGKDTWNGHTLAELEGQDFTYRFQATLTPTSLLLDLSIVSEADSLVGIHYYYHLPPGPASVHTPSQVIPLRENHLDTTHHPHANPLEGDILLKTATHHLHTRYTSTSQENAWQLYHLKDASFVCIEPVSSQDPRRPNLTVSSLHIALTPTQNNV